MVEGSKQTWTEASELMQFLLCTPEEMHPQYYIVNISLGKAVMVCVLWKEHDHLNWSALEMKTMR